MRVRPRTPLALLSTSLLTLGCPADDRGDGQDDEVGDSDTESDSTGSDTDTSTDTDTGSETDSGMETDTSTETETETGTETDTETETDTDTDTDTDTGGVEPCEEPCEADTPCLSADADPGQVIGALVRSGARSDDDISQVRFQRADGSELLVRDDVVVEYQVSGAGQWAFIAEMPDDCASSSLGALVDRNTGDAIWEGLPIPHTVTRSAVQPDGRVVIESYDCGDTDPHFVVLEDDALLDEGEGEPVHLTIRANDWLPIYRPHNSAEEEPPPEEFYAWRKVSTGQEFGPTYPLAAWQARFTPSGELVYAAEINGDWTIVVEAPESIELIPAPAIEALFAEGWYGTFEWEHGDWQLRPYEFVSEWSLLRTWKPGESDRFFRLSPDNELEEVTPTPPPGTVLPKCTTPNLDHLGRLLMVWFDGDAASMMRQDDPDTWTTLGLPMHDVGWMGGGEFGESHYLHSKFSNNNFCDTPWGRPPANALTDDSAQYIRGPVTFVAPDARSHRIDAEGRCVAYSQMKDFQGPWGEGWSIVDLAGNAIFDIPHAGVHLFEWFEG
ncbi:hypothetical protein PPSIR1_19329 [Plesiocystis pacifica SIR-1]|uniref:Uncharacterized protein n=1 Tax=Plesiocystis pacifica SIR-1 TaxID=391625 RepID=A6G831_9BACT|nr:hypothetical protein [Plesiocystis pacifica]EDM77993.1 hypothetical protein PPSIR1_19329 [Plesiocystis pacifica SIR-1]